MQPPHAPIPPKLALLALCGMLLLAPGAADAACPAMGWIINASRARQLHKAGALFLDVRKKGAYQQAHAKGAIHVTWQQFSSRKIPHVGRLLQSDKALQKALRAVGVSQPTPVVVYGDPRKGWGEEGRITWMLRSVGHRCAAFVDGGFRALKRAKLPIAQTPTKHNSRGDINVRRTRRWSITRQRLRQLLTRKSNASVRIVDTREMREYNGATPYGETRGGHLPGAVHLYYKQLLNSRGFLRPKAQLKALLKKAGISRGTKVIAYCTGGIRSAWLTSVLVHLGYQNAKNYAGSMWEWSAFPAKSHPLVK